MGRPGETCYDMARKETKMRTSEIMRLRNMFLKAFVICHAVIVMTWLLSLTNFYPWLLGLFYPGWGVRETHVFILNMLGMFKIGSFLMFLVPAAALHLEYLCEKK